MRRIRSALTRFVDWVLVRRVVTYPEGAEHIPHPMRVDPRLQAPSREPAARAMGTFGIGSS